MHLTLSKIALDDPGQLSSIACRSPDISHVAPCSSGVVSGPGGNQTGRPNTVGAGAASRDYSEEGSGDRYYGLHVDVPTEKLAAELSRLVQEDGSLLEPVPLCGAKVAQNNPGRTKGKGRFGLDPEGRLDMGVHNSNKPGVCVRGGTIPVTTEKPPHKVARFATAPLRAGRIVIRNQNNQGQLKKTR